jgi:hypothetical protein
MGMAEPPSEPDLLADAVVWEEEGAWLGHLRAHPDYWTQGETLADLYDHLEDLRIELSRSEAGRSGPAS